MRLFPAMWSLGTRPPKSKKLGLFQNYDFATNKDTLSVTLRVPPPPKGEARGGAGTTPWFSLWGELSIEVRRRVFLCLSRFSILQQALFNMKIKIAS